MKKQMKWLTVVLVLLAVLMCGCGGSEESETNPTETERERQTEEPEMWPKVEKYRDGIKYEFDKENWAYYKLEDKGYGEEAGVNIYCEEEGLGEMCFLLMLPELKKNFQNFSLGAIIGEETIVYLVLDGDILNNNTPKFNEKDASAECIKKATAFRDSCARYLIGDDFVASGLDGLGLEEEGDQIENEEYELFVEYSEVPTYDDLLRYPDSYKEIKIKVSAKITKVEPDGIIFDGDIEGEMGGEPIALYDSRKTKEPRLREGDLVTIYGYGRGLTTVKVQDVSSLIPKTVDKYDIPSIDMRYIEFE